MAFYPTTDFDEKIAASSYNRIGWFDRRNPRYHLRLCDRGERQGIHSNVAGDRERFALGAILRRRNGNGGVGSCHSLPDRVYSGGGVLRRQPEIEFSDAAR